VLYPEEHWDRVARRAAWPPLVAGLFAGVIAVGLTTLLARRFTDRVRQLSNQARMIAAGQFTSLPLPATDDEVRDLAAALNQMSERLSKYEEQVRRSERLRTLGQLGAGIAHQLRNSATGARLALELHSADLPAGTDRESLDVALRQLSLMETSLKRFLRLGRSEQLPTQTVNLVQLIDETVPLVEPSCRHANIHLEWHPPPRPISMTGESDSLRQLLLNLLLNAIEAATDASGSTGIVRIEIEEPHEGGRQVVLRVLDSGPGPPADIAPHLFEPFATSKPDGTGLGLSVAQEIAQSHGATLTWRRADQMTCFEICFSAIPDEVGLP
jgi:signal transduction histidine kinase